ncbi:MAG: hypothetical protein ABJP45_00275 [Cyclobacteriaceae bacterium]
MKKLYIPLILSIGLALLSCEEGPPGPPGFDGIDGLNGQESFVFEYEFSFTAPEYSVLLNLPEDFVMLDSDVMLVYFLWDVQDDVEVWRALSQQLYFTDGILSYNFDHTKFDTNVFLDGTVDLDGLGANHTDNWIARVVVVPGQFSNGRTSLNLSDYNQVKEYFDLGPSQLATEKYLSRPK